MTLRMKLLQEISEENERNKYISFLCSFHNEVNTLNTSTSILSNIVTEIENYLMTDYLICVADPLIFWFTNAIKYPILSKSNIFVFYTIRKNIFNDREYSGQKTKQTKRKYYKQNTFLNSYINDK